MSKQHVERIARLVETVMFKYMCSAQDVRRVAGLILLRQSNATAHAHYSLNATARMFELEDGQ